MSVTLRKSSDPVTLVKSTDRPFVNYPTLLPSQGRTTDTPEPVDYSDGYGVEYAVGE